MPVGKKEDVIENREAISYSTLARFNEVGKNKTAEFSETYEMVLGKYFEAVIREMFDDSYDSNDFFYVGNVNQRFINAVLGGEPLETLVRIKKDGNPYEADSDLFCMIKNHIADKMPIKIEDCQMIQQTVEHLLCLNIYGTKLYEFFSAAQFDVPFIWETADICKKAIFDALSIIETAEGSVGICFDFKLSRSSHGFAGDFRNRYWIQDRHYAEGFSKFCSEKNKSVVDIPYVVFVCGYKDTGLCQLNMIDLDSIERAQDKYTDLILRFTEWIESGKKVTGYLDDRYLRVY